MEFNNEKQHNEKQHPGMIPLAMILLNRRMRDRMINRRWKPSCIPFVRQTAKASATSRVLSGIWHGAISNWSYRLAIHI